MMIHSRKTFVIAVLLASGLGEAGALDREAIVRENEGAALVLWGTNPATGTEVQGSGCCVNTDGYVLTVAHQVAGLTAFRARLRDGTDRRLTLVAVDAAREVALLKADAPMPRAVRLGDASRLRSGSELVAIAAPVGLEFSVVRGIVSSMNRTRRGHPMIQTDLPASPGSSGGPVFDERGELVGLIVNRLVSEEWIKMVTPVNNAYDMLAAHGLPIPGAAAPPAAGEIIPARGVSRVELQGINAYNAGVLASAPAEKVAAYAQAVRLLPAFFEGWFNLAAACTASDDLAQAVQAYQEAQALAATPAQAMATHRNLGRLYLRMQDAPAAVACFEKAAALAPDDASCHNDLGEALRRTENLAEAEKSFRTALELRPDYSAAHYNLGLALSAAGNPSEAVAHFRRYLELEPNASDAGQVRQWIAQLEGR